MGKNRIVTMLWQEGGDRLIFPVIDESATWRVFNAEGGPYVIPGAEDYGTALRNDLFLFPANLGLTEPDLRALFPSDEDLGATLSYQRLTDNAALPRIELPGRLPVVSVLTDVQGRDYGTYDAAVVLREGIYFSV